MIILSDPIIRKIIRLFVRFVLKLRLDLFVYLSIKDFYNFHIFFLDADFCNIRFFAALWKIDQSVPVSTFIKANPPVHTFMNTLMRILFFLHDDLNIIHHLHITYLRMVL